MHVIIGVTAAVVAMFFILAMSLSDENLSGVTGTVGIVRLVFSDEEGVCLTDEPLQYIIRGEDTQRLIEFLKAETDNYYIMDSYSGEATIKGVYYKYSIRSFTNMFLIVTFTKI